MLPINALKLERHNGKGQEGATHNYYEVRKYTHPKHIIDQLKWKKRCSNITEMKRMLPIHTHIKTRNYHKGASYAFWCRTY